MITYGDSYLVGVIPGTPTKLGRLKDVSFSDDLNLVQVRRHKKRRINKKWAKRYGYITKFRTVNIENISVNRNEDGYDIH